MSNLDITSLSKYSETPSLSFDSHDQAIDYVLHLKERSLRRRALEEIDICKRYEHSELAVVLNMLAPGDNNQFHLIVRAIPLGRNTQGDKTPWDFHAFGGKRPDGNDGRNDDFVFIGVCQMVNGPQNIISSGVWAASGHEIKDFIRQVSGAAGVQASHIWQTVPKGEFGMPAALVSCLGYGMTRLIESRPENYQYLESDHRNLARQWLCELDLVRILGSIRIDINDVNVWAGISERQAGGFKLVNTVLSVLNAVPRAA